MTRQAINAAAVLAAALVFLASAVPVPAAERLAVLIAAPWPGEIAMSQDQAAAAIALRRRGFTTGQMLVVDGEQTRESLLRFLVTVKQRIASWTDGDVFMLVGAHGAFTGMKVADARPALLLGTREPLAGQMLFWDEIFTALAVPPGVRLVLLPDA
jgi:hypothetical protein